MESLPLPIEFIDTISHFIIRVFNSTFLSPFDSPFQGSFLFSFLQHHKAEVKPLGRSKLLKAPKAGCVGLRNLREPLEQLPELCFKSCSSSCGCSMLHHER